jgi:hypothetical protein
LQQGYALQGSDDDPVRFEKQEEINNSRQFFRIFLLMSRPLKGRLFPTPKDELFHREKNLPTSTAIADDIYAATSPRQGHFFEKDIYPRFFCFDNEVFIALKYKETEEKGRV